MCARACVGGGGRAECVAGGLSKFGRLPTGSGPSETAIAPSLGIGWHPVAHEILKLTVQSGLLRLLVSTPMFFLVHESSSNNAGFVVRA